MRARVIRLAVLVVALAVGAAACGKYSISNIRSLKAFQDANALYKKGEYSRAAQRYTDAVTLNPDLGFAYFFLGNSYDNLYKPGRRGEPENDANLPKAAENYRLAVEKMSASTDPKELEIRKLAFEYLIAVYGPEKLNDFTKAEPVAKELIALAPNDPTGYQTLGRLYEDVGRPEDAYQIYQDGVRRYPTSAEFYYHLGVMKWGQGDVTEGIALLRKACELNQQYFDWYNALFTALWQSDRKPEALDVLRGWVRAHPEDREGARNLKLFEDSLSAAGR